MRSKKLHSISGDERYHELLQALEYDGKHIEYLTKEIVEKIDQMLDNNLFNQTNFDHIQSLSHDSIVHIPNLIENQVHDSKSYLIIKSNQRLEILLEHIKYQMFLFTENAEKIQGLIDLNIIFNENIDYEIQSLWKNELVQMQGQISSYQMDIIIYYRHRSDTGKNLLKQTTDTNDDWRQLIDIDEEFFSKLKTILCNLRLFNLRLHHIVYLWIHSSKNT